MNLMMVGRGGMEHSIQSIAFSNSWEGKRECPIKERTSGRGLISASLF